MTSCISGDAAAALGQLARTRWELATEEKLDAVTVSSDPWPDALDVDFRDISVAIARTLPEFDKQTQISEIEAAKLAIIASTTTCLYIESQYFASRKIAEAIAARLREAEGPEIILINPQGAEGWLEAKAMDSARIRLMKLVRDADHHGRFRLMYPVNDKRTPIYVHAKVMIADDRLIKIGSANLNNRSMGYDTECDIVIEARSDQAILSAKIIQHRNGLIAEHLGCDQQELERQIEEHGSVIRAIDVLNRHGRGLVDVPMRDLTADETLFAESDLADPERPSGVKERVIRKIHRRRAG